MILKISHIGIAVKDLESSNELFSKLFAQNNPYTEHVPQEKVNLSFFPISDSILELIEPTDASSSLSSFINKRGEGLHHICLEVDDIKYEINRLKKLGFTFINNEPTVGGEGFLISFLNPKSTNGVLIELCQKQ
ncbi:MAG: methylmalonyl-CoA epimerase [Bacteroidetes bacterium]|nr:methylmalonyl-CoA epimerase [Bacteroidota bacterium]